MKHKVWLILILSLILMLSASSGYAYLAGYGLDWWSVDGGGGSSGSGQYTLSGAIGQADAGRLTSPQYSLAGGFWVGSAPHAVQFFLPVVIK